MNEQTLFFHFLVPTPSQTRYREYSANRRRAEGLSIFAISYAFMLGGSSPAGDKSIGIC